MDTATTSLKTIMESGDYERVPSVAIFDVHEEWENGKLARKFDKEALEEIARVCNARRDETGNLIAFGPGHLNSKKGEMDLPPIWGYASEVRVGPFGPKEKIGLLVDYYVKKQVDIPDGVGGTKTVSGKEALSQFPKPSIELWFKDKVIDWIALLKRTPERDLGLTVYEKLPWETGPRYYPSQDKTNPLSCSFDGKKLRYAMDDSPVDPPDNDDLDDDDKKKADKYWKHHLKSNKVLRYMCSAKKYEEEADQYAAFPSPTNTNLPKGLPKEPMHMSKETEVITPPAVSSDQLQALTDRLDALTKENEALKSTL